MNMGARAGRSHMGSRKQDWVRNGVEPKERRGRLGGLRTKIQIQVKIPGLCPDHSREVDISRGDR